MSYYSTAVTNKMNSIKTGTNLLFQFENYTYHARLSFMSLKNYEEYTRLKEENKIVQAKALVKSKGITITESGAVHSPNIDSITINTTFGWNTTGLKPDTIMTELDLKLTDPTGSNLTNKINTVARLLGYEAILMLPFFLTVSFIGYSPSKVGDALDSIPTSSDDTEFIYELIAGNCTSSVEATKTTYNFKMFPNSSYPFAKSSMSLANLGVIHIPDGTNSIEAIAKTAQDYINEKEKASYPDGVYEQLYKNEPAFIYKVLDEDDTVLYTGDKKRMAVVEQGTTINSSAPKGKPAEIQTASVPLHWERQEKFSGSNSKSNSTTFDGINSFRPDNTTTVSNLFTTFLNENVNATNGNLGVSSKTDFSYKYVGSYAGKNVYQTIAIVRMIKIPALEEAKKYAGDPNPFANLEEEQLNYLTECETANLFIRKYSYLSDGGTTGVLSYDTKLDNLWFMNLGLTQLELSNSSNINTYTDNGRLDNDTGKRLIPNGDNIETIANTQSKKMDELKTLNDYWDYAMSENLLTKQTFFPFAVADDGFSSQVIRTNAPLSPEETLQRTKSLIGYNNLMSAGNASEITLKILGDPCWLNVSAVTSNSDYKKYYLAHCIFTLNSQTTLDKLDNYVRDSINTYTMPYIVTSVVSYLADGKFTQGLKGTIPLPFLKTESPSTKG